MSSALPIDPLRPEFVTALEAGPVVVESPTGSGKSTRLPLWCAERGPVLVVEPRRLACRALGLYLADGEPGGEVGYAIRFEQRLGPETRVVFATPGVALRWLAEGRLGDFPTVMLDEFHERRWDTDLLLALLTRRDHPGLVLCSATLDGRRLAEFLGGSLLRAEGRLFPVEVHQPAGTDPPFSRDLERRVGDAVGRALALTASGDVLVFLPGRGEIQRCLDHLRGRVDAEVLPLHAGTDGAAQDRVLRPADGRRIILATNVAETSVTIPGVTAVVDSGLERRTHHRNGRTVLGLHRVSQAAAEQRRGRAGRVAPGVCLRLWGRSAPLEALTPPEVVREELTDLVLAAAAAGAPAGELRFPDPLPAHALERALGQLVAMDAVTPHGHITGHGRRLFPLPLDPLFAHLITAMADAPTRGAMVDLAAALSAGRPLLRGPLPLDAQAALDDWAPGGCDATALIRLVRERPPPELAPDGPALAEARRIADQVRTAVGLAGRQGEPLPAREGFLAAVLAAAPELGYVRRTRRRHALGNGRDEVETGRDSRLPEEAEAAVVFDQHSVPGKGTRQTVSYATVMAPVSLTLLADAGLGERVRRDPAWAHGNLEVVEEQVYAGRVLRRRSITPQGASARAALAQLILEGRLLAPAGRRLQDDVTAWNLYLHLGEGEGDPAEALPWLEERLAGLGVEEPADVALLEPEDLAFPGIPSWEREGFERRYPRRLQLENLPVRVVYEPRRRRITLERDGGTRRNVPTTGELPRWPGWSVRYRDGSRVVTVR